MIRLTRLNGQSTWLNPTHIVTVEATPDTLVTLFGGEKLLVREGASAVAEQVVDFYRRVGYVPPSVPTETTSPADSEE